MGFGVINSDTRAAWQRIADEASKQRPSVGRRVRIVGGRKHRGKEGVVERHEHDRYDTGAWRYGGEANLHMREMLGRSGWRCMVRADDGTAFWVSAAHAHCLDDRDAAARGY